MKEPNPFAVKNFVYCHYTPLLNYYQSEMEFCKECYDDFWKFKKGAKVVE